MGKSRPPPRARRSISPRSQRPRTADAPRVISRSCPSSAATGHLRGRHVAAKNIVESYEKTLEGTPENEYEHGEMLLYKNLLLEESGDLPRALEHLEECESQLVDKLFYKHKRAEL